MCIIKYIIWYVWLIWLTHGNLARKDRATGDVKLTLTIITMYFQAYITDINIGYPGQRGNSLPHGPVENQPFWICLLQPKISGQSTKIWQCHWWNGATIKYHEINGIVVSPNKTGFFGRTRNDGTNGPCKVSQIAVKLFVGCPQMCRCCSTLWDHDFLTWNIHRTWPMPVMTGISWCNINLQSYWNTIRQLLLSAFTMLPERMLSKSLYMWDYTGIWWYMLSNVNSFV